MTRVKFAIGIGLILSMLTACGSDDDGSTAAAESSSVTTATTTNKTTTAYVADEPDEDIIQPETVASYLNETGMEDFGLFSFNEEMNAFQFSITDPGLAMEIAGITATSSTLSSWRGLTDSFDGLCIEIQEMLGDGYSVMVMNPANEENILYWVMDGVTMYDFTTE